MISGYPKMRSQNMMGGMEESGFCASLFHHRDKYDLSFYSTVQYSVCRNIINTETPALSPLGMVQRTLALALPIWNLHFNWQSSFTPFPTSLSRKHAGPMSSMMNFNPDENSTEA